MVRGRDNNRIPGNLADYLEQMEQRLVDTNAELEKMKEKTQKSGDAFAKLVPSLENFVASPLFSGFTQGLQNLSSLIGSGAGGAFSYLGGDAAQHARSAFGTLAAEADAQSQLEGVAERFGRAGISVDARTIDGMRSRLVNRSQIVQGNLRAASDALVSHEQDKTSQALDGNSAIDKMGEWLSDFSWNWKKAEGRYKAQQDMLKAGAVQRKQ